MALSDYMPYGAPELLDGASPRMARSTLVASGLVATMVCCLGILSSRPPAARTPIDEIVYQLQPLPPVYYETSPELMAVPVKVSRPDGEIRPLPDESTIEPAFEQPEPAGPIAPPRGGEPDVVGGSKEDGLAPSPDPLPNEFVYTDELPQPVRGVKPVYPDLAREAGVEGTVKLQLLVGLDGHVLRAIVRPGGSVPMLDETAIAAALQCVFTPALANGRPVKVWVTQDYRFKLH